ncbi:HTH domain-containing protein [Flavobacterium luteum]|uniref:HTH domain-containing protein n=1 Tax=Flavobacterium luteum TaxID=2026654 RepID=A0A7J5AKC8_9FLAO|nr:HTH domain-containing protein [Flavobacterium luteum]KAB1157940.1 HTH domain-containing protein [Flavobacterium luteum]
MDIRIIIELDNLINKEITGSPKQLASKLSMTERTVYNYISFMKKTLNAPIVYDYQRMSYVYNSDGEFKFIR